MIDVEYNAELIINAVNKCTADKKFRQICSETDNPYYLGDAGKKIAKILAKTTIDSALIRKKMTLKGECKNGWFS